MHSHTVRIALTIAALAVVALTGRALAPASAGALGAAGSAAKPTYLNYYESPCYTAARKAFHVPLFNDARVAWELSNAGTARAREFHAALHACPPVAKWDWDAMVLVGTE